MNRETIIQGLFRRPMDPEADAVSITDIGLCLIGGGCILFLFTIIGVLLSGWMPGFGG